MQGEEKIPHHYCDEAEIMDTYKGHDTNIRPYTYSFYDKQNNEYYIQAYVLYTKKVFWGVIMELDINKIVFEKTTLDEVNLEELRIIDKQ